MDLDQMKNTWAELSDGLAQQQPLHDEEILKMTQKRSSSRLNRIIYMESFGIILSLVMFVYVLINLPQLDDWLTLSAGIALLLIIGLGIALALIIIRKAKKINLLQHSYQQTLANYVSLKKTLRLYKKLAIPMNVLLPFLVLPVFFKLFLGANILDDWGSFGKNLVAAFTITPIILFIIIRYYKKNMREVRESLESLDQH